MNFKSFFIDAGLYFRIKQSPLINPEISVLNILSKLIKRNKLFCTFTTTSAIKTKFTQFYTLRYSKINVDKLSKSSRRHFLRGKDRFYSEIFVAFNEINDFQLNEIYNFYIFVSSKYSSGLKKYTKLEFNELLKSNFKDSGLIFLSRNKENNQITSLIINSYINNSFFMDLVYFHPEFLAKSVSYFSYVENVNFLFDKYKCETVHNGLKNLLHKTNVQEFLEKNLCFSKNMPLVILFGTL